MLHMHDAHFPAASSAVGEMKGGREGPDVW